MIRELEIYKDIRSNLWGIRDLDGRVLYDPSMPQRMAKNLLLVEQLINDGSRSQLEDPSQYITDSGNINADKLLPVLIEKLLGAKREMAALREAAQELYPPAR